MSTTKRIVGTVALLGALGLGIETASAQNPVIGNTGTHVTGVYFDWTTMQWKVRTDQQVILNSALDPNRNVIDPGSYRYVDRYFRDWNGVLWHETGYKWTSLGVPHSNLTRHRVNRIGPGVAVDQNVTILKSVAPPQTTARPLRRIVTRNRVLGTNWFDAEF